MGNQLRKPAEEKGQTEHSHRNGNTQRQESRLILQPQAGQSPGKPGPPIPTAPGGPFLFIHTSLFFFSSSLHFPSVFMPHRPLQPVVLTVSPLLSPLLSTLWLFLSPSWSAGSDLPVCLFPVHPPLSWPLSFPLLRVLSVSLSVSLCLLFFPLSLF